MIEGFIGRPGAGKSYLLTRRVLAEADKGRRCFVNWGLIHPNVFYFTPDQLMDLPPGLVAIDEAHLWFPARMSLQLPMSWLAGMSQTRKAGWDMLWAAQHESRVDKVVRDVTSWMYLTSAWLSWDNHPLLFRQISYEPEFFRRQDKRMTTSWYWFSKSVAARYDTHERLEQAEHTAAKADHYAAKKSAGTSSSGSRSRRGASLLEGHLE